MSHVSPEEKKHEVEKGMVAVVPERGLEKRVLEEVLKTPGLSLEDLVEACPDLSWNQVFLEVDRLSRKGIIALKCESAGCYRIRFSGCLEACGERGRRGKS